MNQCIFSPDRVYRYVLRRHCADLISKRAGRIAWIGLNPSTADELTLDQTLAAVCRYSSKWGYSEVVMLNLFAFRATDPRDLKKAADPVGPDNDRHILAEVRDAERVIVCWGNHGRYRGRDQQVRALLATTGIGCECLVQNKAGAPHHPLYLKRRIKPSSWRVLSPSDTLRRVQKKDQLESGLRRLLRIKSESEQSTLVRKHKKRS